MWICWQDSIIQKKCDQTTTKNVYLWTILYLTSTFENLSLTKSIKDLWMFTKHYTCKMSFDYCYKIVCIIFINKIKQLCACFMKKSMVNNKFIEIITCFTIQIF
jgi:hypothetical protein